MTDAAGERASLEDQRDFLLRSLEDLEREHEVGDVDDVDHTALKDDYTARAAAVLRALEQDGPRRRPRRSRPGGRRLATALAVLAIAGVAGLLVAQASGRRDAGELGSGDVRQSVTEKLNEAGRRFADGEANAAIALYDEVLEAQPANAEALAYKGWALYTLVGGAEATSAALDSLLEAATADPDYPDAHAYLAVLLFQGGLVEQADRELDRLDALDPPADIVELTSTLRAQIDAALAVTTTTVP